MEILNLKLGGGGLGLSLWEHPRTPANYYLMSELNLRQWLKPLDAFLSLYVLSISGSCEKSTPSGNNGTPFGYWRCELATLALCNCSVLCHTSMNSQLCVLPLKSAFGPCVALAPFAASLPTLASILQNESRQIKLPVMYLLLAAATFDDAFFRQLLEPCLLTHQVWRPTAEPSRPGMDDGDGLPGSTQLAGV